MKATLFLSVVVPTYNRRESLKVTLAALARQTYSRDQFEVIVVSDGSTDGTHEMLVELAQTLPYSLRVITQENAGPARARNNGVTNAQGEVIVFLDDDVEPIPELLTLHALHHKNDSRVAVIGPMSPDPARRREEPPWIAWEHAMLEKQYACFRSGEWPCPGPPNFYSGNASLRREHLLAVGGFDETFGRQEDVELAYRLQRDRSLRFAFDAEAVGIHRPVRTLNSWLRVPSSYGRLDVVRARRADAPWDLLRRSYTSRNAATRLLASLMLACPPLAQPLETTLLLSANLSHRLRMPPRLAHTALSALYNLRYLRGAQEELGSATAMRRLLVGKNPAPVSPA